jgi:hypothetical protein
MPIKDTPIRNLILPALVSVSFAVGAQALYLWKDTTLLAQRIEQLEQDNREHKAEIKKIYEIDGSMKILIEEVQNLRSDLKSALNGPQNRRR